MRLDKLRYIAVGLIAIAKRQRNNEAYAHILHLDPFE
jgi:hypothetical protein